jgi:hypothetical protein
LVALAALDSDAINSSFIHVPVKSSFILQWLDLLDIPADRIVDHAVIAASTLLVPEMGRCGCPYRSQLQWLRATFIPAALSKLSPHRLHSSASAAGKRIILIKRTKSRPVRNFSVLEEALRALAAQMVPPWHLVIHADDRLPPLAAQIALFAEVDTRIVVAPHGAGELFAAFLPKGAGLVELISESQACLVYARLTYLLDIPYVQVPMDSAGIVSRDQLLEAVQALL